MGIKQILTLIKSGGVKLFRYNWFCKHIKTTSYLPLQLTRHCVFDFSEGSELHIGQTIQVGVQLVKGSKMETRIQLQKGAKMIVPTHYIIHEGSFITVTPNSMLILHAGFINENVQITCGDKIEIGEGTAIARDVIIRSFDGHPIDGQSMSAPITIGKHVWIGQRAMILKGVTIGDDAVIAAGAVVTKDIPAGCLAAGVPAKVIRENVKWS